ncbi:PAS domain-containing protein [Sulfuricurvum sp. MLSB]|uniref:PAS domain-containing protein n=2 Tax=unclassified Sulfuricurvum TaxID=2632390 RepID=UPI000AB543F7|nr:PAS domain-containing protein [Sulfuricurvum sp. MLSB]
MKESTLERSLQREAKFEPNELFFSITDIESTILSGNEVFIRISGYTKEEVLGRYHNIVRHPDMPRIVFKLIWDYLRAGKPIVGYVKNRAKSGAYYWVLAAIFPLEDRYVSIRIKPTTRLLAAIQELYPLLLGAEKRGGMEESAAILPDFLNNLGYHDYNEFMSDALLHELQERRCLSSAPREERTGSHTPFAQQLQGVQRHTKMLINAYDAWFDKINLFIQTKSMFEEKSLVLRQVAREVVFLSLNASVSSYKVENGGETFGILARDVRTNAKENDELIGRIDTLVQLLAGSLNDLIFSVSGIRLQTEALSYFIDELLCENCNVEHHEIEANMDTLVLLVSDHSKKTEALQITIDHQLQEALGHLDQLERQIMYLGYIQVYGIIEAAGNPHETVSFEGIFSQLKTLIRTTTGEIEAMQKMGSGFYTENRSLLNQSIEIGTVLHTLHDEIACLKNMK